MKLVNPNERAHLSQLATGAHIYISYDPLSGPALFWTTHEAAAPTPCRTVLRDLLRAGLAQQSEPGVPTYHITEAGRRAALAPVAL